MPDQAELIVDTFSTRPVPMPSSDVAEPSMADVSRSALLQTNADDA